jgi:murein L,D-transpeptidase YafK
MAELQVSRLAASLLLLLPAFFAEAAEPRSDTFRADRIVIAKATRDRALLANGEVFKTYRVALGGSPVGPKEREGDRKTPEGTYVIDFRKPDSTFHRALHISYPGPEDLQRAGERGVSPGGDIMIHGLGEGVEWAGTDHRYFDWTRGCIAVTNEEIDEIWRIVPDGTPVEIRP